ncbi:glycine zipper 2TM domain-containing protein [Sphingomonas tabacisoli]|uniref:17 kDa surface antigen n=1 Tax=Sphingomonas tabacisoli TaxID=2249466 RepID=A0ABW4HZJ4_9SPHN
MRKIIIALSAVALSVPTVVVPTSAADAAYRTWRGKDGRMYCRRPNGTTGLLVGGAAGALIGRSLDGGRNRATGTILGAAGGALLGREVQRSSARQRCR